MSRKNKNPYTVKSSDMIQCRIHKDLAAVLDSEVRKQQRISDVRFGKNKFKVRRSFASKILGGFLK